MVSKRTIFDSKRPGFLADLIYEGIKSMNEIVILIIQQDGAEIWFLPYP